MEGFLVVAGIHLLLIYNYVARSVSGFSAAKPLENRIFFFY